MFGPGILDRVFLVVYTFFPLLTLFCVQTSETASDDGSSVTSQDAVSKHREIEQLKEQVATLTSSLATVTAGKSKMEATFQADKKKIRVRLL